MSVVMKPSCVEWIGDIPEHWDVSMIKRFARVKRGASPRPIADQKYFDDNGEFAWVRIADVSASEKYLLNTTQRLSELGSSHSVKQYPGDLFISIAGTVGKPIISNIKCCIHDGFVWFDEPTFNKDFIYFIFYAGLPYGGLGKLGTQLNLNTDTIGKIYIPKIPKDEQKSIANFLDKATSQIDNAIKTKQTQLETLEVLKKSIIHKAVTKGLDESVTMIDSKIDWIGEIPEHWTTQKLKRTTSIKGRIGWQGLTSDEYRTEGQHMLVTGTDFKGRYINWGTCHYVDEERYAEDTKIQLIDKDVLVTKDGTIGKVSMVKDMPYPTTLNSGVFVTRPIKNDYIQEYMYWVLYSDMLMEFIEYSKVGTTIAHLYQKTFERFIYALPPLEEQQPIVDFLDKEVEKINTLKSNVQKQVDKLQEYKKSIIYEYVTGKKQVKE